MNENAMITHGNLIEKGCKKPILTSAFLIL